MSEEEAMRQAVIEDLALAGAPPGHGTRGRHAAPLFADLQALLSPAPSAWPAEARRPFALAPAVAEALAECAPQLARAIVAQRLRPVAVLGCPAQVTRVLVHLLRNAARATAGAGRPAVIRIDALGEGARVHVRISDNGHGIAPAVLPRIFEPFFSTRAHGASLGLGLTLSRAIVQAHGGTLRCANRVPHGARFEFDLPAAAPGTA